MPQVEWTRHHPFVDLGRLPEFLHDDDPRSAIEQLNAGYAFAGGWKRQDGFKLTDANALLYPDDPPMRPLASAKLRDETIILYPYSYVAVIAPDRTFQVCRMD